ncbi:hypothetical protein SAMN05192562_101988 [Kosakonia arachidis]|uniref:Uncharacterized protein n=1 Tax=Kosakonia arachidis TaxID=551989 RepID=A0A1I6Z703_9ENTR|nr:hypothetical protein SAMN05192562_101988 [Kosakonia arachidis]
MLSNLQNNKPSLSAMKSLHQMILFRHRFLDSGIMWVYARKPLLLSELDMGTGYEFSLLL